MSDVLHVLLVEDNPDDAELIRLALSRGPATVVMTRVEDAEALREALAEGEWDVVISDYALPHFSGPGALAVVQESELDLPFIVVSGTIGEDTAVEMMRGGAHDYLMKDNLTRLLPAVEHEIAGAQARRERREAQAALRESEERFRAVFDRSAVGIAVTATDRQHLDCNDALLDMLGLTREEFLATDTDAFTHPDDRNFDPTLWHQLVAGQRTSYQRETRYLHRDGHVVWVRLTVSLAAFGAAGQVAAVAMVEDISDRKRASDRLRESEERHRQMFEHMSSGVAVYEVVGDGEDFIFRDFNAAAERIAAVSRTEVLGRPLLEVFPSAVEIGLLDVLRRVSQTGQSEYHPPAFCRDVLCSGWRESFVYKLPAGQIVAMYDDVTDRVEAQNLLHDTSERLQAVIDAAPAAVVMLDAEGTVSLWNPAAERIFGWTEEEVLAEGFPDRPEGEGELFLAVARQVMEGGSFTDLAMRIPCKDGTEIDVSISAGPVHDPEGNIVAAMGVLADITERAAAARILQESEERFRRVYEETPVPYQSLDADGCLLEANPSWLNALDYTRDEVVGKHFAEFLAPEDRPLFAERFARLKEVGAGSGGEYQMVRRDGTKLTVQFEARVVYNADGSFRQTHCVFQDITKRARAEWELANLNRLYSVLSQINETIIRVSSPQDLYEQACRIAVETGGLQVAWVGLVDPETRQVRPVAWAGASDGYVEGITISAAEVPEGLGPTGTAIREGRTVVSADIEHDAQMAPWREDALARGYRSSVALPLRLGDEVIGALNLYAAQAQFFTTAELHPLENMSADISFALHVLREADLRSRADAALQATAERLAVTLRSIADCVITTDTEGRIILINAAAEELTGWTEAEAMGRHADEALRLVDERAVHQRRSPVQEVLATQETLAWPSHTLLLARDGREHNVTVSGAPIRDGDGHNVGVVLVFRDVTEEQRLRAEALKAQKLESLGVLAGGIAHDFNNALLVISGNLQMARMLASDDPKHDTLLENAERACIQSRDLTQQLLTFAKGGVPVKEITAVDTLVRDTALFAVSGSNVRCEFDIAPDLRAAEVDPGQLSQVVNNLVINADQAMPTGGVMHLGLHNVTLNDTSPIPLPPGEYLRLSVADSGTGIPPEHLDRIFDPYFTTKAKGNGLGLASCYSIIQKHGGHLGVTSELGVGSTFTIHLPTSDQQVSTQDVSQQTIPTGTGRILVMDDEVAVRELAAILLEDLGYAVEMVADGDEAVAKYREAMAAGEPFAAVILDLTIRGAMGGIETVAALRAIDPDVRAIVCSGYSADPVMAQHAEHGFCAVVVKPYNVSELAQAVCRATRRENDGGDDAGR